ncbi:pyrophosphatase [Vulcanibacillus modesticaldus]|uniref:Pyrophosphatase n=1 Tax=Vulcanibacillus modesticaldus TaxID=337097 RepID=A0A1D2YWS0_9BACI|nr:pyrophosphatase PpaX [Vulcanibacillus modesticaldus]OEG00112.1 pyrophosphatase [Vulcanibacillus modesticaldus]
MRYKTILFDLDGTLINTNELIINSFLYTLEKYFPNKYNRESLIPHFGKPLHDQMVILGNEELAPEMVKTYREHNIKNHDRFVEEFPHVKEVISQLYDFGAKLGVVTTKMSTTALMGLKLFELDKFMSTVIAYEDTELHKPAPDPIILAMERLEADPRTTLMLGDSQYDIQAAQNAGITSIGVGWSIKGKDFIRGYNPDYIIDDMRELLSIVKG